MRKIFSLLLGICAATSVSFAAYAQQYPTKPVTIVVHLPCSDSADYNPAFQGTRS